jgi:hypothetical protein
MPFTFSHPAAVVPLARRGLLLSPLIVGSMAPDFPYFLQLSTASMYGHTLPGVFPFCIPAGLAALWVFHGVLEMPLLSLLPDGPHERLAGLAGNFRFGPWNRFLMVVFCLLVGALSHIAWDSFTHAEGWMVQRLPSLRVPIIHIAGETIRIYKMLQHGSTVGGLALLVYWYLRWYRTAPSPQVCPSRRFSTATRRTLAVSLVAIPSTVAVVYGLLTLVPASSLEILRQFAGHAVLFGGVCGMIEVVLYGIWWHWRVT